MSERVEIISSYLVLPTGMAADDNESNVFGAKVEWRGPYAGRSGGGYLVTIRGRELSRAGKWGHPERFQRWQYRWETFEEAVNAARKVVDHVKVQGGYTWAQWNTERAEHHAGWRP